MSGKPKRVRTSGASRWLTGGGEMGKLIREVDWSKTPLGPIDSWPQSLKTSILLTLNSRYPMFVWWGRELTNLYNDAYIPILGARHPGALGEPAARVWAEIWDVIGPQTEIVMREGRATWNESLLLVVERHGYTEETYFTFSYSPAMGDDGNVGGVFCACTEDTRRILGERRLRTLRALAEQATQAKSAEEACGVAAATMRENPYDLPFAMVYLLDEDGVRARLAGATMTGAPAGPAMIELHGEADGEWPLGQVVESGESQVVSDLEAKLDESARLCGGPWPEPARQAVVAPLERPGQTTPSGFLIAGVSPRLLLDEDYRGFLELTAGHIAAALANVRAYEEERRRAEALAEIDRAKTVFFSNISHEFRTPLTLMLGPLEDTLAEDGLPPQAHDRLEVARRNSLRLLKLVNTLLDFSRIEAGRIQAVYEPVDLAKFTTDLASVFRSTVERAGLELVVDCQPLSEPVYVDREMWEKIVLNLLSNAFKFTFEGEISVKLRVADCGLRNEEEEERGEVDEQGARKSAIRNPQSAILTVRDTGTGIPEAELPHLFERFHRVKGARGRSYEGSGIGLALVQELVKLHCGEIRVESEVDRGSEFTVTIPLGKAHLPAERIGAARSLAPTALRGEAYVEEALRWLPSEEVGTRGQGDRETRRETENLLVPLSPPPLVSPSRILLADDNADMREYVRRLLGGQYEVEAVADGEAALNAVRESAPDLVLTDVMMPKLDGLGLLRELRADERLKTVPVILLSARAGEEARVEGMEAGADDYLVKPFSARELLARVEAHLKLHRLRREAELAERESERRFREIIDALPAAIYTTDAEGRLTSFNPAAVKFSGRTPELGTDQWCVSWKLYYPDGAPMPYDKCPMAVALKEGRGIRGEEAIAERPDGTRIWFEPYPTPLRNTEGRIVGGINMLLDITERKKAEEKLAEASRRFHAHVNNSPLAAIEFDPEFRVTAWSEGAERMFGWSAAETLGKRVEDLRWVHEADVEGVDAICREMLTGQGLRYNHVNRNYRKDGSVIECEWYNSVLRDANGKMVSLNSQVLDVTERKRAEEALREREQHYRALTELSPQVIFLSRPDGYLTYINQHGVEFSGQPVEELLGAGWANFIHPESRERIVNIWKKSIQEVSDYEVEIPFILHDGSVHRFYTKALPVKDDAGAVLYWIGTAFDVEDLKRAEDELRKSEERFRAIVSQATAGIVEADLTGRLIFANQRFCEIVGYSGDELRALRMYDITHPDDLPESVELFSRLAEGGPDFVVEKRYVRKDGGEVWVNNSVNAVRDAEGRVRSIVAVSLDITERRRAEAALAEALALNRTITDNTQSCLWMMDAQGRGTFANHASERVSGFKPEELIGQVLHEKVHHTHPDGTPFPIEECPLDRALPLQEAVVGYEDVFVHKDGHFYPVRCAGRPIIMNGEPIGTVIEVQDITEERRAAADRERLLEEERRHGRNLQRLNAASVAINAATAIEEVVLLIIEKARELTGARMAVVNLVHDGDWERSRSSPSLSGGYATWGDYDAQVTGERIYSLVAREKRTMRMTQAELESNPAWRGFGAEAGEHPPLRGWMAAPLLDGDGECIGVVQLSDKWVGAAAGEFTEADEALLWQLAQVASVALENQQLYKQEQEARRMAEQATRAKDEFLAVVSHELRSPLNAILGWNRLLRSRRGGDPQIARVTETVESSGKAQLRLIEDLLDTARIISGKMRLETQPVELVAVIESALDAVRPAADSKGIIIVPDFSLEAGQMSYQITGDPDRLQQVVWNLVSNAIKFTPDGGRVWVGLRRDGSGAQIIVRDTGQGISPDLLPYVFDRFKQGDSSVSRRFGGLGLGLALVKHLVELHGGSVVAESPGEGRGATFTVSLPAAAVKGDVDAESRGEWETVVARLAPRGPRPTSLSGLRALLVEDEAGARELITLTLEQNGALVTSVDSAASALAALESRLEDGTARMPFDVLISDIGMPDADGYELIRRVRAHADERVSHIRAVALTAYARTEDRLRALQAGFHMHVPKPVDEAELTTVIAALTGRTPGRA
jgi:PAS domain S-box-containing protein